VQNQAQKKPILDLSQAWEYASLAGAVRFAGKKKELSTPDEVLNSNEVWRSLADALRTFSQ
jgi:hypothetical protein